MDVAHSSVIPNHVESLAAIEQEKKRVFWLRCATEGAMHTEHTAIKDIV